MNISSCNTIHVPDDLTRFTSYNLNPISLYLTSSVLLISLKNKVRNESDKMQCGNQKRMQIIGNYLLSESIFAARMKSLSVSPLILWV